MYLMYYVLPIMPTQRYAYFNKRRYFHLMEISVLFLLLSDVTREIENYHGYFLQTL